MKLSSGRREVAVGLGMAVLSAVVLGALLYALAEGGKQERPSEGWPETVGIARSTRVTRHPPLENFPITMYIGECQVEYFVDGKRYSLWASSGYEDPDPKFIADRMVECPASRYWVQYNPANPSEASAEREF
jgi:hypothetical protein